MISKEVFEIIENDKIFNSIMFDRILFTYKHNNYQSYIQINDFFFRCVEYISRKGYVFIQDTRGYAKIKKLSNNTIYKIWEDEEYNKQRIFDACKVILENN